MNIVQVSTFSPYMLGGQEAVVYNLSKELVKNGHKVTVLASDINSKTTPEPAEFDALHISSWRFNDRFIVPKKIDDIRRLIRNADVVHVHSPDASFAFELALLSKLMKKPVVTSILSYFDSFKHPFISMKLLAFPLESSLTFLAKISDSIQVKNVGDYNKLSRVCKNLAFIPDGIPDSYFNEPKNPGFFTKKFGIDNKKIILYVGRLHPLKGPQILIRSLKFLLTYDPEILLVIAGPGKEYRRQLEALTEQLGLKKHVQFVGILSEKEKISAYDAAKVVVVPSCSDFVEAFSLVASEAWARGKPVVASNIGALRYRVVPKKNGFLVPPNNPQCLAENILNAFELKLTQIPKDVCKWDFVAKNFEQLYDDCVKN